MSAIRVIYIVGRAHSGSTLLDLLISSHSQVCSVGEAKVLGRHRKRCTCGAASIAACPFWQAVDARLLASGGPALGELRLDAEEPALCQDHNLAFFRAVAEVSGKPWVVDSSKSPRRLARLLSFGDALELCPVHLVRSPYGLAFSSVRHGRDWVETCRRHTRDTLATAALLADRRHLRVEYEALAREPERQLRSVMAEAGLAYQPQQLQWGGRVRHNVGGNGMRFRDSGVIREDVAWRAGLSPWQKVGIAWLALPLKLPGLLRRPLQPLLALGPASRLGRAGRRLFRVFF